MNLLMLTFILLLHIIYTIIIATITVTFTVIFPFIIYYHVLFTISFFPSFYLFIYFFHSFILIYIYICAFMFVCLWVYPFKGGGLGTLLKGKLQTVRPTIKMFVHVHYMNDFLLRHKDILKKKRKKGRKKARTSFHSQNVRARFSCLSAIPCWQLLTT